MNVIQRVGIIAILSGLAFILTSCDGGKPFKDLNAYIAKLKEAKVEKSEKADADLKAKQPVTATYEAAAKRSPFEVMDAAPKKDRVISNPLQAYPLDVLRFVGTVTQNGSTIAFISAPDNKIYQIKAGDIIGDHDSEVTQIDSDRISLTEQYSENGSTPMKRVVTLQLKEASQ